MKLKENTTYHYDDDSECLTIINGTKMYSIKDTNQKYHWMLQHNLFSDEMKAFLLKNNLIDNLSDDMTVNSRSWFYFRDRLLSTVKSARPIKNILKNQCFIIIGCGGIGTVVLDNLIRMGFENFTIVDGDIVEKSNLNRQLFYTCYDVGQSKVKILKDRLQQYSFNDIKIHSCKKYIKNSTDLASIAYDESEKKVLVVNCADTPFDLVNVIGNFCMQKKYTFVYAGVGIETGTISPIYDGKNPYKVIDVSKERTLTGSISSNNMITGAMLSQKIMDYLFKQYFVLNKEIYKENIITFDKFGN
ncbi:ThiF family protein [Ligilactobacillus sp. WC1T17]|uniref:ThiF family protein n=1 Tax=Ligilactobacillus ruminis TaxID=1623 RepID=A0ABY1A902_9LACO|nr:ThiF family protein [Ligilactobacillus ruminis]